MHTCRTLFSGTGVSRHQKGKRSWIITKQEMDHLQIIWTSLRTDNHANTSSLNILQAGCFSRCQINSVKALKALHHITLHTKFVEHRLTQLASSARNDVSCQRSNTSPKSSALSVLCLKCHSVRCSADVELSCSKQPDQQSWSHAH